MTDTTQDNQNYNCACAHPSQCDQSCYPRLTVGTQDNDAMMPCPICAEAFNPDDLCASDIEMGTCHAACLEGSPIVDLATGEETGGKVDTYPYSEVAEPATTGGRDDG